MLKEAIARLMKREDLDRSEISAVFDEIFSGHATPAQIAGFLVALRMKGETPEEIAGGAETMRKNVTKVRVPKGRIVLDTCGTGGDGSQSFNISTAVAFVAAMCIMHSFDPRQWYAKGSPYGDQYFEPSKSRTLTLQPCNCASSVVSASRMRFSMRCCSSSVGSPNA